MFWITNGLLILVFRYDAKNNDLIGNTRAMLTQSLKAE